jgi:hypothetical protein
MDALFHLSQWKINVDPEKVKCIAIVRTDWYNGVKKGNTKIYERSVILWQQNQLICTQG